MKTRTLSWEIDDSHKHILKSERPPEYGSSIVGGIDYPTSGCLPGPPSVKYIIVNEACERYSFYALRSILLLYLTDELGFSDDMGMTVVSAMIMTAYFSPLLGGFIADNYWGKFRTIVVFSIFYIISAACLAASAINFTWWMALLGLFGIGMATGGIKPCISSFGADQFHVQDTESVATFFSVFYMSINIASFCSTIVTPIIRSEVSYFIAFALPVIFLTLSIFIFLCGKNMYKRVAPAGSILSRIWPAIYYVFWTARSVPNRLDVAGTMFGDDVADMVKSLTVVIPVLSFFPIFWTVYDIQPSAWVLQAKDMKRYGLQPEQMGALNTVLILIFVPFLDRVIYPMCRRMNINMDHMRRLTIGLIFTIISSLFTAGVQYLVDNNDEETVPIFYQIPQYVFVSIGEAFVSVTLLEFSYLSASEQLKGIVSSLNLLTTALGNLLSVLVFSICGYFDVSIFTQLLIFAGLITLNTLIFWCTLVRRRKHYSFDDDPPPNRTSSIASYYRHRDTMI